MSVQIPSLENVTWVDDTTPAITAARLNALWAVAVALQGKNISESSSEVQIKVGNSFVSQIVFDGDPQDQITALAQGKENASNKVTSISSASTDTQYPSAKCVYDAVNTVQSYANNLSLTKADKTVVALKADKTALALTDKKLRYLAELTKGQVWDVEAGTTPAYQQSVPSGAKAVAVNGVGGKTVVFNQIFDPESSSWMMGFKNGTTKGITCTRNADGTASITGTSTESGTLGGSPIIYNAVFISGHKYYLRGSGSDISNYGLCINSRDNPIDNGYILTGGTINNVVFAFSGGVTINATISLYAVDLTKMFGAGNEPSTVQAVKEILTEDYYPYNTGSLLSANVTSVDSKDSNSVSLGSLAIPQALRTAYPLHSAGSVYDEYDIENKKFIQRVGVVDMGTLGWVIYNNRFVANVAGIANKSEGQPSNLLCSRYATYPAATSGGGADGGIYKDSSPGVSVYVYDTGFSDAASLKASLSGVYLFYELATPVETDISEHFTDDNLLTVEAGGTLTFAQSNAVTSNLSVSNDTEYAVQLSDAV